MSHDRHTESSWNDDLLVDIGGGYVQKLSRMDARDHYLSLLDGYVCPYPDPRVVCSGDTAGIRVVRDDLVVGTKARAGDPVVGLSDSERFVYVQPRTGLAGVSLLDVTKRRGRDLVLFMPASKRISRHQACCIERGAHPLFERIAAMPNLNALARRWALENGAEFIPLGLKHPLATAGIVLAASKIPEPEYVFLAVSTGVLSRALQIAWPKAKFVGVAVSRNLQEGERGEMRLFSEPLPFQTPEKPENLPPFPTVPTYDGKAWKYCLDFKLGAGKFSDVLFWNVGCDPVVQDESVYDRVSSQREWRKKSPTLTEIAQ